MTTPGYDVRLNRVRGFVEHYGVRELFLKPIRTIFAPLVVRVLPRRRFTFDGISLQYVYHRYNTTWACERCVEIPIGRHYLRRREGQDVLEVGNVLSYYGAIAHDVVDKFDRRRGVVNEDVTTFAAAKKYDLILSISTFEHIGFDYDVSHAPTGGVQAALDACQRLLKPGGATLITVPIGYNPQLDGRIRAGLGADREIYLARVGRLEWRTTTKADALSRRYGHPFPYANAILVAEFRADTERTDRA